MPTYQYRCTECDRDLEVVQKFTDASLTECPACSGQLRKVFNAVGVVFKGSGFYRTDSRAADKDSARSEKSGDSGEKLKEPGEKSGDKTAAKPVTVEAGKNGSSNGSQNGGTNGSKNGGESSSSSGKGKADKVPAGSSSSSSTGS